MFFGVLNILYLHYLNKKNMKKILMMATVAFLVTGVAFAQDKTTEKKKCTKDCCKGKECKKKDCDKSKEAKTTTTTSTSTSKKS